MAASSGTLTESIALACAQQKRLKDVTTLDVSAHGLTDLNGPVLDRLVHLEDLDASHNNLSAVPLSRSLQRLSRLNLSNNNIESVDLLNAQNFPSLETLVISGNSRLPPYHLYQLVDQLPALRTLDGKNMETRKQGVKNERNTTREKVEQTWKAMTAKGPPPTLEAFQAACRKSFAASMSTYTQFLRHLHDVIACDVYNRENRAKKRKEPSAEESESHVPKKAKKTKAQEKKERQAKTQMGEEEGEDGEGEESDERTQPLLRSDSLNPEQIPEYRVRSVYKMHQKDDSSPVTNSITQVFDCCFEPQSEGSSAQTPMFATTGGHSSTLKELTRTTINMRFPSPTDTLYTCAWSKLIAPPTATTTSLASRSSLFAHAGEKGIVTVADPSRKTILARLHHAEGAPGLSAVYALCFHPTQPRLLLSGGASGILKCWFIRVKGDKVDTSVVLKHDCQSRINAIAFNSSGSLLCVGLNDSSMRLFKVKLASPSSASLSISLDSPKHLKGTSFHTKNVDSIVHLYDNVFLSKAACEARLLLWSADSVYRNPLPEVPVEELKWHQNNELFIKAAASKDGDLILVGDATGALHMYHSRSGVYLCRLPQHSHEDARSILRSVAISDDNEYVVGTYDRNLVVVWVRTHTAS